MATQTKSPSKNGTANTKPSTNGQSKPEKLKAVNIDDRIKRVNRLTELGKQREKLIERKNDLEQFEFGSDKMKDQLVIVDGQGNRFDTSNSNLIEGLTGHLKTLMIGKIEQVEQDLIEAEI